MQHPPCDNCKSSKTVKNGIVRNVQRYKCKKCGYNFSEHLKRRILTEELKEKLLIDYFALELFPGKYPKISMRKLARKNNINHVTATKWIKEYRSSRALQDKIMSLVEQEWEKPQ